MKGRKLVLIGGGGHCRSCIDVIELAGGYVIDTIIDTPDKVGEKVLQYEITGSDPDIPGLIGEDVSFLITLGQIKTGARRKELFQYLKRLGAVLPIVKSPLAYKSPYSAVEEGSILMHHAVLNAGSRLGANCIVNTGAVIDHDSRIGSHVHLSTNAVINGGCVIGDGCFIGSNAVVNHNISVVEGVVIGSGTVVNKDITEAGIYVGSPARRLS